MKTTSNNGTTAAQVNERAQQYDEVTKVIRISFEHDGRMSAEDAREYVAERVHSYAAAHAYTIDEGTHILDVQDMGEPEPVKHPTFYEAAREFIEMHYNNSTDRDQLAAFMAEDISRAAAEVFGKGPAAYLLDVIANRVQSWCNPALSDEEEEEPARLLVVFRDESQYRRARDFYCLKASEAPTAFYAEEYSDEIRALYFNENPDTLDALERDLTEDLEHYGFTGYHFEQD